MERAAVRMASSVVSLTCAFGIHGSRKAIIKHLYKKEMKRQMIFDII
jgi:hypothetical protein